MVSEMPCPGSIQRSRCYGRNAVRRDSVVQIMYQERGEAVKLRTINVLDNQNQQNLDYAVMTLTEVVNGLDLLGRVVQNDNPALSATLGLHENKVVEARAMVNAVIMAATMRDDKPVHLQERVF